MSRIYRFIDDPPSILLWEIDEIVIFSFLLILGVLTDTVGILLLISFIVNYFVSRLKEQMSEGFMLHYIYWLGLYKFKGSFPSPSIVNRYIE